MAHADCFDGMLESVTSRLEASAADRGAAADELDEMVRRNIEDVVQAANIDADGAGPFLGGAEGLVGGPLEGGGGQRLGRPASGTRPASGASAGRRSSGAGAGPSGGGDGGGDLGSAHLDVPGNASATIRLHKARIRGLEDEVEKLAQALSERDRQLATARKDLKAAKADSASVSKAQKSAEAAAERAAREKAAAADAAAAREAGLREQLAEAGRADKERGRRDAEARARDVRLARALEEVDKYKAMLSDVRTQERESRDATKGDAAHLLAENKRLERSRAELLVAFKKQLKLVDVLKRQKLHLEAARALQFTEQEFLATLEMGTA